MSTNEGAPASLPVVAPTGDLDADTLGPLAADLDAATAGHPGVILDAGGITFGDSTFLRLVLSTHQRTDLRIAAAPPVVTRLFELIGVDSVLRLYPSVRAAQAGSPRP
ncbi:STAS domain-containing protein [Streptantibioticus silvisoli]|uniref:STAS domain-containing protein n=1 Tax=Streptantibioticus silvisoli TaxID=2705255 RepID=A0ABT6W1U8_9ACTN|nr:STAS domain-containing protein [Streptantibioticus silvisoli]MDI5964724.1 STAS domain-containing protein [Streptantibioticus silvisoli]